MVRNVSESERIEMPNGGWRAEYGIREILIRDFDGTFHSFRVPTWESDVVIPLRIWGQWDFTCADFGPKTVDGMLQPDTTIRCHSSEIMLNSDSMAQWSIDGKSLTHPYPDLPKLRCKASDSGNIQCF